MNSGPATFDGHVYVGSRTDSSPGHESPGILVVDSSDPARPEVVDEIGAPRLGETSRELRVWPRRRLLIVLNFACEKALHDCTERGVPPSVRFYDLGRPASPRLLGTYRPSATPHEMYLWEDPTRPDRALLFLTTFDAPGPDLIVTDISRAEEGVFDEIVRWDGAAGFRSRALPAPALLHSLGISRDGSRAYLAFWGGGLLVADISEVTRGVPGPEVRLITAPRDRARWPGAHAHSAVPLSGGSSVLVTDEVYRPCPWGWGHVVDVTEERRPRFVTEFRIPENEPGFCETPTRGNSYSSHNPTVAGDVALITWHSGGLRAFSFEDPAHPVESGSFLPEPLEAVATEDPALSTGSSKVVMWSYPIVSEGLIYVVDLRNGLYVLRYRGPGREMVEGTRFAEGNSNITVAPPGPTPTTAGSPSPAPPINGFERRDTPFGWGPFAAGALVLAGAVLLVVMLRRRI